MVEENPETEGADPASELIPIPVPQLYASIFTMVTNSNGINVLLGATGPSFSKSTGQVVEGNQPIAFLMMSPQSAKDFFILLGNAVRKYENDFGAIETDFTKRIDRKPMGEPITAS